MSSRTYSIPAHLPILPLPENQVLYPASVLSIKLVAKHSIALLQSVLRDAEQNAGNKPLIIGVVPLKDHTAPGNERLTDPSSRKKDPYQTPPASDDEDVKSKAVVPYRGAGTQAGLKPAIDELYEFGVAARIVRLERLNAGGFIAVLEGLARIGLNMDQFGPSSLPFHETSIRILKTTPLSTKSPLLEALQTSTVKLLDTMALVSPLSPLITRRLKALTSQLTADSAPMLVDSLIATIPVNSSTGLLFRDRLAILSALDGDDRVALGIEIFGRVDESLNLKKRIGDKVDQNASRRQREYLLMQQLIAIRQELEELAADDAKKGGPPAGSILGRIGKGGKRPSAPNGEDADDEDGEGDDMAELEKKIKAKSWTEESKKVVTREFKRLKKSPPQGSEHGVIRNYIDWLLALPWNESTPLSLSKDFIEQARKQLDDDHYGLEKVKKRLLEWLAVLRLKQEQWEIENEASQKETKAITASTQDLVDASSTSTMLTPISDASAPPPSANDSPSPSIPRSLSSAKPRDKGPILLLCGPPGTGKTSIAKSLATAMGRKFHRISLGGVRDEAEIRGHRRTYVAALPGALAQALRKCGTNNPVILLDEIDKLGTSSTHGDPGAALLEVLDPEQNNSFEDHYLGIPLDLSSVLFIATANTLDTISEPLFDRMETIELSGYVHSEKLAIAKKYLIPKQLKSNALPPNLLSISDDVLIQLITSYTHEAGVRTLEREIGAVCRAKAVQYTQAKDRAESANDASGRQGADVTQYGYRAEVTKEDLEEILGQSKWDPEEMDRENMIGVATGLAYQGSGNGGVLHIETTSMPGSGNFKLTGQLGEVITESAGLALAWIKSHAFELGISHSRDEDVFKRVDIHLHMPQGSVKKDGPSAGVAFVVAMISLMRGIRMRKGVAMTGEITLRGNVTPVGGIREKVLGAHRAGIRTLILPYKNRKDVSNDLPQEIRADVTFVFVRNIFEALEAAFGKDQLWSGTDGEGRRDKVMSEVESRL